MAIKAVIPAGQTVVTVNGLHQWDYGQTLEVHDDTLPALVEIHFACAGMDEAVVRPCATVNGVASAVIPDQCLAQITPIAAWVYGVEEASGQTLRTIVLQVTPRVRPATSASVPVKIANQYTELIAEVNRQITALGDGSVVVARALAADYAAEASVARTATNANHAKTADSAASAETAGHAETAGSTESAERATVLSPTHSFPGVTDAYISLPGIYAVMYYHRDAGVYFSDIIGVSNIERYTSSRCTYYAPDEDGQGGHLMHMEGEDLGNYTISMLTRLAAYPAG